MVICWQRVNLLAFLNVMFSCVFVTFPCGVLGQVWYLIVSIPDLCHLIYFCWTDGLGCFDGLSDLGGFVGWMMEVLL